MNKIKRNIPTRLDANKTILNHIQSANTVLPTNLIQVGEYLHRVFTLSLVTIVGHLHWNSILCK